MRLPLMNTVPIVLMAALVGVGAYFPAQAASGGQTLVAQMSDDNQDAAQPEDASSAAAMTVRIDRMEGTIRSLTGQIEQLQFQNRKLTDDLRKMQQDVDFRFQDLSRPAGTGLPSSKPAPAKKTELDQPAPSESLPQDTSSVGVPAAGAFIPPRQTTRRSDAFDADSNPTAPGAPRPLGTSTPSAPLSGRRDPNASTTVPNAPLDLMKRPGVADAGPDPSTENGLAPIPPGAAPPEPAPFRPASNPNSVASLVPGGTRDEYNADLDLYRQSQYDSAATGLKTFLDKYPRDRMVPDAVYYLGESYTKLGRHREAAEQYLRLSTDFSKAPRAPDALLKLGVALNAMGVREQACATYQEVTRRFPAASSEVRAGVDRELKRAHC